MSGKKVLWLVLVIILLIGGFLRFHWIREVPPGLYPDEAMNGNNALEALSTGAFKIFYPENNGREGLFINIQALSVWLFGNVPWALRIISALFGLLTILGTYLATKELVGYTKLPEDAADRAREKTRVARVTAIALLAAFFLATSYWHLNFSRIGFRAITVPFFSAFGLYFLLRGLRRGKHLNMILAGISTGLGLQTYIAFRFMPFVFAIPIVWYGWQWIKKRPLIQEAGCALCSILLFIFITGVVALPIGYYFLQNPQDFLGRGGQVSIFAGESPLKEFSKSTLATLGMFFIRGDCNWRHNFGCQTELHPLVALFFLLGFVTTIRHIWKNGAKELGGITLLGWFIFMMFPATLTREGLPHALRSIGMIPPVMVFAGLGAWSLWNTVISWLEHAKAKWPQVTMQTNRIQKEFTLFSIFVLLIIPISTYHLYFNKWANNPNTYGAFSTDLLHTGEFLRDNPIETKNYVVTNTSGVEVRGVPMPAQTVMFITDTFPQTEQDKKNVQYVTVEDLLNRNYVLPTGKDEKIFIIFLNGDDRELIAKMKNAMPQFKPYAPSDFATLKNF